MKICLSASEQHGDDSGFINYDEVDDACAFKRPCERLSIEYSIAEMSAGKICSGK